MLQTLAVPTRGQYVSVEVQEFSTNGIIPAKQEDISAFLCAMLTVIKQESDTGSKV